MPLKDFLSVLKDLRQGPVIQYEPWDDKCLKAHIRKSVIEELVKNIGHDRYKVGEGEPLVYFCPHGYPEGEDPEEVTAQRFERILGELNQEPLFKGVTLTMKRSRVAAYNHLQGVSKLNWVATVQFDSEED